MLIARRTFWTTPPRSMCEIPSFYNQFSPISVELIQKMIIFQTKFRPSQLTNSVELSNFDVSKLFVGARKQWQIGADGFGSVHLGVAFSVFRHTETKTKHTEKNTILEGNKK